MTTRGTALHRARRLAAMTALALGLTGLGLVTAGPASAVTAMDDIANAGTISLTTNPVNYGPTVTGATLQTAEHGQDGCDPIDHSIWYSYTATDNQVAHLNTTGGHDMVVNVWTSPTPATPTIGSLQPVTCDDESDSPDASVYWQLTSGTTYFVQIANYKGPSDVNAGGAFTFAKSAAPGNNPVANATTVTLDASATITNTEFSTLEPGEVAKSGNCGDPYNSVWFKWTPATATGVDAQTLGGVTGRDTLLNVYTGSAATIAALAPVGCNDDIGGLPVDRHSRVGFLATAGTTYYFEVSDLLLPGAVSHTTPGSVLFRITTHPAPVNDLLADASVATVPSTVAADTTFASNEAGEKQPTGSGCSTVGHSLWYRYQPTTSGTLGVETLGSTTIDTNLAVYSGPASGATFAALTQVGCNDDVGGPNVLSAVTVPVTAGTTYYVQVGNFTGAGPQSGPFQVHFISGTTTNLAATSAGRTVTLAASVAGLGGPTNVGQVQFLDGAKAKGTVPLESDGTAVLTVGAATPGAHSYKAVFVPDDAGDFTTSESAVKAVTVTDAPAAPGAAPSTTKLTVPKTVVQGKKAAIGISVSTASGPATGQVLVVVSGKLVTVALTNGKATLSTKLKTPGSVSVVAVYAGSDTARSSSATAKIKVKKPKKK